MKSGRRVARLILLLLGMSLVLATLWPTDAAEAATVVFPDANLETAIREALNKPTGDITTEDLAGLTVLDAAWRGIQDLAGLDNATNLTELHLNGNQINDISPLSLLTNLTRLNLNWNQISDISALSSLTSLTDLSLFGNQIDDISVLSVLTGLTKLDVEGNQISDISVLSSLTNLTELIPIPSEDTIKHLERSL